MERPQISETVLPVVPDISLSPNMAKEMGMYWEKEGILNFTPGHLLAVLIRNHRQLFEGFTTEDDLGYMLERVEDSLPIARRSRGEFTPWIIEVFHHAQDVAGE